MQKWSRTLSWVLTLALVVSLFSGIGSLNAKAAGQHLSIKGLDPQAQSTPAISQTYPEATELLTNIGYMDNSEKAWTESITADEANTLIAHLYATFGWTPETFGMSALTGDTVSGNDFITNGAASLCWSGMSADLATKYFKLSRGIDGYDKTAVLTREEAAQIYLNLLKSNTDYEITKIKANDGAIGLELIKTADASRANRPVYQWFKNGQPVTKAYADTPIAVFRGGVTFNDLMRAVGIDEETSIAMSGVGGIAVGHMGYTLAHGTFTQVVNGDPINMNGDSAWKLTVCENDGSVYTPPVTDTFPSNFIIEVYDSYYLQVDTVSYPGFNSRGYVLHANNVCLGTLNDYEGTQKLNYYFAGGNGAYWGSWSGSDCGYSFDGLSDGYYQAIFNTTTFTLRGLKKAKVVEGTFTSIAYPNIVVGSKTYCYEGNFGLGVDLAVDPNNIGKTFIFYLDDMDYIIGMKQCSHENAWSDWTVDGDKHVRHCTNCFLEQSGTHDIPAAWIPMEGGTHHSKACTVCGGAGTTQEHTLSGWICSTEDATKCVRNCEICGYSESQDHVPGELVNFVAPEVGNPGYSGDRYCIHCNTKVVTGEVTSTVCTHIPGEPVKENEVAPDCNVPGGYDEVIYCTVEACGEKLSSTHHMLDALEHSWVESNRTEATDIVNGVIRYVCQHNAAHTKEEIIPATLTGKTDYSQAAEVLAAIAMIDPDSQIWKANITGAEANKILQILYDGPGFVTPWSANLPAEAAVTGTEFLTKLMMPLGYGGWTIDIKEMTGYLHLLRDLPVELDLSAPLTREVAAQITLNALKSIPEYDSDHIKANDGNIGLTLVKVSQDDMGRPSYKWQKNGLDISAVYADTPLFKLYAGMSWEVVLNGVGLTKTFAGVGIHGWIRTSENGGDLSEYILHYHEDPDSGVYKNGDWFLEVYDDYANHTGIFAGNGYTFKTHGYTVLSLSGKNIPNDAEETEQPDTAPSISHINTDYREAVQLMIALGWMESGANWKGDITGAEANRILQTLYDAPGFVAPWTADFPQNGKVTGKEFTSDALVTIGWNYGNDPLFTLYNHLEKGLNGDYSANGNLSREEAAQITLNTLRAVSGYNSENYKFQDGPIGLTLVLVKQDSMGRPYYKWQKNGMDLTHTYRDRPLYAAQAGVTWSDIMTALGHSPEVSLQQQFRWCIEGKDMTQFVIKQHPDNNAFLDPDYAMEIYQDFHHAHTSYSYTIACYEGEVNVPATADTAAPMLACGLAMAAAAAVCVMLVNKKKETI